jgi:hypothetical protein
MIKSLSGVCGITVSAGTPSLPYIPVNPSNPIQGMLRINNTELEVFTGNGWQQLSTNHATVSLDQELLEVIQWARTQRTMAMNRLSLAQNNPALMKSLEKLKKAENEFEFLSKFVENDESGIVVGYNFNQP